MLLNFFFGLLIIVFFFLLLSFLTNDKAFKTTLLMIIFALLTFLTIASFNLQEKKCNPNTTTYEILNSTTNTTYKITITTNYYCEMQRVYEPTLTWLLFGFSIITLVFAFTNLFSILEL